MENVIQLFEEGKVKTGDREFTRLVGGFGEGKPCITTKYISDLTDYELRVVNQTIERNIDKFEENIHIIDLKKIINHSDYLLKLGYSSISIGRSGSKFYGLSHEGFLLYLQIANIKDNYSKFEKEYFGENNLKVISVRYENCFGELLKTLLDSICTFIPQYSSCSKYRIDFYEVSYKLALEYDENDHVYNTVADLKRQNEIENELGCEFIRVKKGQEIQGINEIFKYLLNLNKKAKENV